MRKKFVITGGHHNSALVVAKKLISKNCDVVWIGHRHASHHDKNDSAEFIEVSSSQIPFFDLKAGKIDQNSKLINILRLPTGLIAAYQILKREKPTAVLSFGSYLGATVSFAAWMQKIPVFVHEQTVVAGKANLFVAKFARRIYLTWPHSSKYYRDDKSLLVGLPLRESIIKPKITKLFTNDFPTILIMGGKQGSHAINQIIFASLNKLLKKYNIIHQTGTTSATNDYEKALSIKESLDEKSSLRYLVRGYIPEDEIGHLLASSDLVISRSGAHTTYELAIQQKRAILIPYIHTHKREQLKNAHLLEKSKQAIILSQSTLDPKVLLTTISIQLASKRPIKALKIPTSATSAIVADLIAQTAND